MRQDTELLTLADAVAFHARTRPDAIAFVAGDAEMSFALLDRRANQVARALQALGVTPGSHVAWLGKNSIEFMEVAASTVRCGAVFTPLNWRLAAAEVAVMLDDCAAPLILVDAEYLAMVEALRPGLAYLKNCICVGGTVPPGWEDYAAWRDRQSAEAVHHAAAPGDIALLIYTSGTTGRPKGVMLSHRNVRSLPGLEYGEGWPQWNQWAPEDTSLVTSPMFHVGGIGWVVRALFPGSRQIILREFSPKGVIDALKRHRITRMALVPSAMRMVLQEPDTATTDLSSLQYIYYGTSPIPLALLRDGMQVFGCRFVQSYGQTETASCIVCMAPDDHTLEDLPHMRAAGKPLPGVEIVIQDESGKVLPTGAIGEIVTRSTSNMAGYLNLPDETAATLRPGGWLRTGDAGRFDDKGFLYVQDRIKEMIITGGENVYPAEVENALYGHPAVGDVAVIGVPSEKWGQAVKAVVELRPGQQATEAELIAWARQRIGGYKLPKSVDFIAALPRNTTGKVVKGELRKLYAQQVGSAP
jgi:acyl-CoA synthetase (AMP-forming)/AMP-acid ligase II